MDQIANTTYNELINSYMELVEKYMKRRRQLSIQLIDFLKKRIDKITRNKLEIIKKIKRNITENAKLFIVSETNDIPINLVPIPYEYPCSRGPRSYINGY